MLRKAVLGTAVAALALIPATTAQAATSVSFSLLLSKSVDGGFPNGASQNGRVSADKRIARYIGYESDATNLVFGDDNGLTDVFVVRRDTSVSSFNSKGSPWVPGAIFLVSRGQGGQPANGRSFGLSLDGDSDQNAHCAAFVSEASNLVAGDTNGVADAFVADLSNRKIRRVSLSSSGKQANAATSDVSISGDCSRVAFSSKATNLAAKATASDRAHRANNGKSQVFVRFLEGDDKGKVLLASVSDSGKTGNGNSTKVEFARKGHAVVFESTSSNLAPDGNGAPDVFLRQFKRFTGKVRPQFEFDTELISATKGGKAGNGASVNPSVDSKGRYVAFQTSATNIAGRTGGHTQIVRADRDKDKKQIVSSNRDGSIGNGDSDNPAISAIGYFVFYDSVATNFRPAGRAADENGQRDIFKWYERTGNSDLESRDFMNAFIQAGSSNPHAGLHGNYVAYQSFDRNVDATVRGLGPSLFPVMYVRYVGPCAQTETQPDGVQLCRLR